MTLITSRASCDAKNRTIPDFFLQIAHIFNQGPKTAKMNSKVTDCQAVLKTMVQLVLQVTLTNNSFLAAPLNDLEYFYIRRW